MQRSEARQQGANEITAAAYAHFAPLVRRQLAALGIRDADLPDLCHEVFLVLHDKVDMVPGVGRVDLWLKAVCRRVATGYRRRCEHKLEILTQDPDATRPDPGHDSPEIGAEPERRQQLALVRRALHQLDDESRDLLALHDVGEMPLTDLARLVDHDRKTVRKRLATARRRVSRLVCQDEPADAPAHMTPPHSPALMLQAAKGYAQGCTADQLSVLHVSEARNVGVLGNVAIATWAHVRPEVIDHLMQTAARSIELCGGEFVYLALLEPTVQPPSLAARQKIVEALEICGPYLKAFALVVPASLTSITEPILNGLMVLARPRFPLRTFAAVEPAAAWLCDGYGRGARGPLSPPELTAAAARLRVLRPGPGP